MGIIEILKQLNKNMETSLKILSVLTKASVSDVEKVSVNINGEQITLPSISYLLRKITKIEEDTAQLYRIKDNETFSTIFASKRQLAAPPVLKSLTPPKEFLDKPNYLVENFLNPLSYIRLNLTDVVSPETNTAVVCRVLLDLDTPAKSDFFEQKILGQSNLVYDWVLEELTKQGISFQQDIEVLTAEPSVLKFTGEFDVVAIDSSPISNSEFNFVRKYTLNKTTYTDTSIGVLDNQTLKIGDVLVSHDNTFYSVVEVDTSKSIVTLGLKSGFKVIDVGVNQLRISSTEVSQKYFDVSIGKSESQIIFLKSIDPYYNTISNSWSPGMGIRTSDLKIIKDGKEIPFDEYQNLFVQNYIQFIKQSDINKLVFLTEGLQPSPPLLKSENFKVLSINNHRNPKLDIPKIRQAILVKERNKQEIDVYQREIARISALIVLSPEDEGLQLLYNQYNDVLTKCVREYNTNLDLLKGLNSDLQLFYDFKPKYRARGFWAFPAPKIDPAGKPQEVIQFIISYRYLDTVDSQPTLTSINFIENDSTTRQGVFSDWIEIATPIRKKVFNPDTSKFIWEDQRVEDPSQVNINQLDLPISYGERVEVRIKSISEAGYPTNYFESEWSPSVIINFPPEFMAETQTQQMIKDIQVELGRLDTIGEIDALREVVRNLTSRLELEKTDRAAGIKELETTISELTQRVSELESP